jgi:hypothetical protein
MAIADAAIAVSSLLPPPAVTFTVFVAVTFAIAVITATAVFFDAAFS